MAITIENQKILKRLQAKGATYSVEKWENEFVDHKRYQNLLAEDHYVYGKGATAEIRSNESLIDSGRMYGDRALSMANDTNASVNLPSIPT